MEVNNVKMSVNLNMNNVSKAKEASAKKTEHAVQTKHEQAKPKAETHDRFEKSNTAENVRQTYNKAGKLNASQNSEHAKQVSNKPMNEAKAGKQTDTAQHVAQSMAVQASANVQTHKHVDAPKKIQSPNKVQAVGGKLNVKA